MGSMQFAPHSRRHLGRMGLGGVTNSSLGKCQTAGPIGTKFGTCLRMLNTIRPSIPQGVFEGGGLGGHKFKSRGK